MSKKKVSKEDVQKCDSSPSTQVVDSKWKFTIPLAVKDGSLWKKASLGTGCLAAGILLASVVLIVIEEPDDPVIVPVEVVEMAPAIEEVVVEIAPAIEEVVVELDIPEADDIVPDEEEVFYAEYVANPESFPCAYIFGNFTDEISRSAAIKNCDVVMLEYMGDQVWFYNAHTTFMTDVTNVFL